MKRAVSTLKNSVINFYSILYMNVGTTSGYNAYQGDETHTFHSFVLTFEGLIVTVSQNGYYLHKPKLFFIKWVLNTA